MSTGFHALYGVPSVPYIDLEKKYKEQEEPVNVAKDVAEAEPISRNIAKLVGGAPKRKAKPPTKRKPPQKKKPQKKQPIKKPKSDTLSVLLCKLAKAFEVETKKTKQQK